MLPSVRSGIANAATFYLAFFVCNFLVSGLSSQIAISLTSAWWACLYVGRFSGSSLGAFGVSTILLVLTNAAMLFGGFDVYLAVKPAVGGEMFGVAFGNALLFSTPILGNLLVDGIVGRLRKANS